MSREKKRARPTPATRQNAASLSKGRLWLYRAILALVIPLVTLLLLELGLRLSGFGHSTAFLLPTQKDGTNYLTQNNRFGWRFFGRQMARAPYPIFIPEKKPPNGVRVFVLGESAAYGDPQPAFGLPRMIQALLELRHPGTRFEVVNAAMTGINSHAILPIARDCAEADADIFVLYIGNNEVVGPFGPGTVFSSQTLPLPLIRASLFTKSTRAGQAIEALLHPAGAGKEWGGMVMFMKQQVGVDDRRLPRVYRNFQRNLDDIVKVGTKHGLGIVLCTISGNLRDCPPFASAHRSTLSEPELRQFEDLWSQGLAARERKDASALENFRKAGVVDSQYASLRFVLGELENVTDQGAQTRKDYEAARDFDTLRFRCDTRLNDIIRELAGARASETLLLADVEQGLIKALRQLPGQEQFYDHVHFTFEGNYLAAREIVPQIENLLGKRGRVALKPDTTWPSMTECAHRLGWNDFQSRAAWLEMLPRLTDPPFINQLDHFARVESVQARIQQLGSTLSSPALTSALEECQQTAKKFSEDAELQLQTAILAEAAANTNAAIAAAQRATELLPTSADAWSHLAAALERSGNLADAAAAYQKVIGLEPDPYYALHSLGRVLESLGKTDDALSAYQRAVRIKPRFGPAWLSLGQLLEKTGHSTQANDPYQRALTNRIRNAPELVRLANFCRERGWFQAAATNLVEALSLGAPDSAGYLRVGLDYSAAGQRSQAKDYFARAVQLNPGSAPAHFLLGRELGVEGKPAEAEAQFREASRLMPDLAEARINLAVTLARQGRMSEAIAEYESILNRWPTNELARRNLELLHQNSRSDIRPRAE